MAVQSNKNYITVAVLVIIIIVAVSVLFLTRTRHVIMGSQSAPFDSALGYQGTGYYRIDGQTKYVTSPNQLNNTNKQSTSLPSSSTIQTTATSTSTISINTTTTQQTSTAVTSATTSVQTTTTTLVTTIVGGSQCVFGCGRASTTSTVIQEDSLAAPTLSASNTLLDSGQYLTLTASESLGTPPYTYTFYNATSGSVPITGCISITVPSCDFIANSPTEGNVFYYGVTVTDSASTSMSSFNQVIAVNESLAVNVLGLIGEEQAGTSQTAIAMVTAGQGPYTYNWLVSNTLGQVFNSLNVGISSTQNSFTFTPIVPGTYVVNVIITDSATTPAKTNGLTSVVANPIVNPSA